MISREELRHLAQLESSHGCAITFYYQPQTPQDRSHREEAIIVKDIAREALRRAERNGNNQELHDDLQRIVEIAERLHGNHSRGKVIFACRELGIWRELDVMPRLGRTQMIVNSRFHLKPLVAADHNVPSALIALVDRKKARLFELRDGNLLQKPELEFGPLLKVGKSDGYLGYDAGHRERHVENETKYHFKQFAESMLSLIGKDKLDVLLIGCRDETWPEIQPQLDSYVKQRLAGRFLADPGNASAEEVRDYAERIMERNRVIEQQSVLREAIGQASRNSTGAVGLRHVLTALERQEVDTLLISRDFQADVVECSNCRHLDTRLVKSCAVCGQPTRELNEVADVLVDLALRNGADIQFFDNDSELEKAGRVAALLRFRADQNTAEKVAV
jgi:peptide subunit release factor 1 (eRF1)